MMELHKRTTPQLVIIDSSDNSGSAVEAVWAEGLSKTYRNGVRALDDVSLHVGAGEVVGVVGPNGAGKSTTLKILATLLKPTSGKAYVAGVSVRESAAARRLLGVGLQEAGLDPLMTGSEHFTVQASLYKLTPASSWESERDDLIARFDLAPYIERAVGTWSLGTQRRLSTALALLHQPAVVLLDEPTAGLDPRSRRYVWDSIKDLRGSEKTVLFSSQYLEEADALCDRIYVIDRGHVVASGTPTELKARLGAKRVILRVESDLPEALAAIQAATAIVGEVRDDTIVLPIKDGLGIVARIIEACTEHNITLTDIGVADPSLDDVFLAVTGEAPSPEPAVRPQMDLTTRRARGGGSRWR
jgi:ABC-2 type transport system ATP-binding protein